MQRGSLGLARVYTGTLTDSSVLNLYNDTKSTYQNLPALTPAFGSTTATADGFTVQISNYSGSYDWPVPQQPAEVLRLVAQD